MSLHRMQQQNLQYKIYYSYFLENKLITRKAMAMLAWQTVSTSERPALE